MPDAKSLFMRYSYALYYKDLLLDYTYISISQSLIPYTYLNIARLPPVTEPILYLGSQGSNHYYSHTGRPSELLLFSSVCEH